MKGPGWAWPFAAGLSSATAAPSPPKVRPARGRPLSSACPVNSPTETTPVNALTKSILILMADDDPDDRMLTKDALEESRLANELRFVFDGEELMDYLCQRNNYSDPASSPRPGLILLDLNMPRKDGREALREIKDNPRFRHIPVVVLTTSKAEEDVFR